MERVLINSQQWHVRYLRWKIEPREKCFVARYGSFPFWNVCGTHLKGSHLGFTYTKSWCCPKYALSVFNIKLCIRTIGTISTHHVIPKFKTQPLLGRIIKWRKQVSDMTVRSRRRCLSIHIMTWSKKEESMNETGGQYDLQIWARMPQQTYMYMNWSKTKERMTGTGEQYNRGWGWLSIKIMTWS